MGAICAVRENECACLVTTTGECTHLGIKTGFVEKGNGHTILLWVGVDDSVGGWQVAVVGQHAQHVADVAHKGPGNGVRGDPLTIRVFDLQCSHMGLLIHQGQQPILLVWCRQVPKGRVNTHVC